MQLRENTLFANRYNLARLLGRGGFSEVWLANDTWTKLDIAIKVYAPGQGMDSNGLQEFCSELANVYDLNHQHLLKPQHVDTWEGMPYLIMAYCPQGSLMKQVGKLTEAQMWKLIADVASGLAYLHSRDVVHQDIKPDNILIDGTGNYVITDFGISTRARSTLRKSVIGGNVSGGTMAYMAPERFSKQPAPTKASDIWSLGAMLFELLTGNVPFGEIGGGLQKGGAEIPEINAPVSDRLKKTIEQMLAKETWDRPTAERLLQIAHHPESIDGQSAKPAAEGRKTQRFTQDRLIENANAIPTDTTPANDKKTYKNKNLLLLLLISIVACLLGVGLYYWDKERTIQFLVEQHQTELQKLEEAYQTIQPDNTDSPNIDALESAIYSWKQLIAYEDAPLYSGETWSTVEYKGKLKSKSIELYALLQKKYLAAPTGTAIRSTLLERRDRVERLANQAGIDPTIPTAKIDSFWVELNVYQSDPIAYNRFGMRIHVKFSVMNCEKLNKGIVFAYFCDEDHIKLKGKNNHYYQDTEGAAIAWKEYTLNAYSTYSDFTLFMPYAEIPTTPNGKYSFNIAIYVGPSNNRVLLKTSDDYIHFWDE